MKERKKERKRITKETLVIPLEALPIPNPMKKDK